MSQPLRRYAYSLAERLGYKKPEELYASLSVADIFGWMAYDKTNDLDWLKDYKDKLELEKSLKMDEEDRAMLIKTMLGG